MASDWSVVLKQSIKDKGVPRGWSVVKSGSKVRLRVRQGVGGKDSWTKTLGHQWEIGCIGPVSTLLSDLYQAVENGATLDEAWAQLYPKEAAADEAGTVNPITGVNWKKIELAYYRDRERNGTKVSTKTMDGDKRYCGQAIELLTGKDAPSGAYKLIDATIEAGGWTDKARARQQCVDAVVRMLTYGVDHEGLDPAWMLRDSMKLKLKGSGKPKSEERPVKALSDADVVELLASVENSKGPLWKNVLLLMDTYGLRPIEVLKLEVRVNPATGAEQLFCNYRKACGGKTKKTETEPRFLFPSPSKDEEGNDICGDLTAAFKAGLMPFPSMKRGAADINQFLGRNSVWKRLAAEAEAEGKWLRPYSFRNSYSVRCHARNVPSALVSNAMGHSDLTHNAYYLTSSDEATARAFEAMNGGS